MRRFSSVDSSPIVSNRRLIVGALSSAARIPLPAPTIAFAMRSRFALSIVTLPPWSAWLECPPLTAPPPLRAPPLRGSRRPPRNSRKAPPPVEIRDTPAVARNDSMAARVSPPPAIENAGLDATASASRAVPRRERRVLEGADRAVPDDRARLAEDPRKVIGALGPMSRIISAAPTSSAGLTDPFASAEELQRGHHVAREHDLEPLRAGAGQQLRGEADSFLVHERRSHRMPRRGEKGIGDAPADDQADRPARRGSEAARSFPPPWRPRPPPRRGVPADGGPARAHPARPRGAAPRRRPGRSG